MVSLFLILDGIIITAIAYVGIHQVDNDFLKITDISMPNIHRFTDMNLNFRTVRIHLRTLGIEGLSESDAQKSLENVEKYIVLIEKAHKEFNQDLATTEEKQLFQNFIQEWANFKEIGSRIVTFHKEGTPESFKKMNQIFLTDCPASAAKIELTIRQMSDYQNQLSNKYKQHALETTDTVDRTTLFVAVVGMSLGVLLSILISKQIARTLTEIAKTLQVSASEVSAASHQIASTSTELSQSTSEQAASLEQTVASIEEMTSIVRKNSDNAETSAQTATTTQSKVVQGKKSIEEVIRAIQAIELSNQSIAGQIDQSNAQMNEIVLLIQEIEQKTKVINDIVFQTKLLSFNASVEAARAGEHGKGFAVVAEEVGNLAQMSGNAAKEISNLLENSVSKVKTIADQTKASVGSMIQQGQSKLVDGIQVAQECSTILDTIVEDINRVTVMSQEISEASIEQTQGITEINKAMNQLDQVTQVNASATEQASAAAEHLSNEASRLKHVTENLIETVQGRMAS